MVSLSLTHNMISHVVVVGWGRTWPWLQQGWLRVSEQKILDWRAAANVQGEKILCNIQYCLHTSTEYSSAHAQVLVLCRVSESSLDKNVHQGNMDGILPFDSQSLASNIYSSWELRLLSWLNMTYQSTRETVWGAGRTHSMETHLQNLISHIVVN